MEIEEYEEVLGEVANEEIDFDALAGTEEYNTEQAPIEDFETTSIGEVSENLEEEKASEEIEQNSIEQEGTQPEEQNQKKAQPETLSQEEVQPNQEEEIEEVELTRVVGIDIANSTLKVWTDELNLKYVNTIREINEAGLVYSFRTDYQMYVYGKQVYEVGLVSAKGSGGRGTARYGSEQYKTEALIGIASCLKEVENLSEHEILRVVTGVPSNLARNQKIIGAIKQMLLGKHEIKSVTWDSVTPIKFEIAEVIVVPQPLGTMYDYVFDKEADALNEKLLDQRAIVIDIGWGTTDIAILETARVRSTFSFDIGTSDYISDMQEDINATMPEASIFSLSAHELDLCLLESPVVETPFGEFDLSNYSEKHKKNQAKRVYQEVMGLGLEFNKFYKIILTGGGSLLYEKYLRELFNDPRLIIQENAVMSNCRGFWLLGNY